VPDDEPRSTTPANGRWNKRRMAAFLRELAATQSVAAAARSVGVSRQSAYRLKNRLVSTPFAFGWEVALEAGFSQLAHAMMDRAVNGVEVPHYYQGELIGTSRSYDERLSIWISSNPWKVGRQQIAREYSAEGFDRLMERIEQGPLDWGEVEFADENGEFPEGGNCGAGPEFVDALPGRDPPVYSAAEAGRAQRDFAHERSWYAALVCQEEPQRPGAGLSSAAGSSPSAA
jgi:hypothetical protein